MRGGEKLEDRDNQVWDYIIPPDKPTPSESKEFTAMKEEEEAVLPEERCGLFWASRLNT